MIFNLPQLPFQTDALQPYMSKETIEHHYGRHHLGYLVELDKCCRGTKFETFTLEEVVKESEGRTYNFAAQAWNHAFFWECLTPNGTRMPKQSLEKAIIRDFGSIEKFEDQFMEIGKNLFGSGWIWLVENGDGKLVLEPQPNAGNPLTQSQRPLLVCDVWEHAYYLDYKHDRTKYLHAFLGLVNWDFAEGQHSRKVK